MTTAALDRFEVVLTSAFLTGQPLQVPVGQSRAMQRALGDGLKGHVDEGWGYEALPFQDAGGSYDGAGGYPSLVPLVLVSRAGEDLRRAVQSELDRRPGAELRWLADLTEGWEWEIANVSIDIFDFGVGVVRCACTVDPPRDLPVGEVRRTLDLFARLKSEAGWPGEPPVAAALEAVTCQTVERLASEVERTVPEARQPTWLEPMIGALGDDVPGQPRRQYRWGRLLWLHPVVVLSTPPSATMDELDMIAGPFKSDFHRCLGVSYGLFAPGIEISVIVGHGSARARDTFLWLISVNWAYYALFMEIDRGLFATLDDDRWRERGSLSQLERDATDMFGIQLRVQTVHARLGSILMDVGGGALTLWEAIVEAQRFDALVEAVTVKVDLLQRVAEQRIAEATAAQARRNGNILRGLSSLTLVTVVIAVIGGLIGSRSDHAGHEVTRIALIIGAVLVAGLLFFVQREAAFKGRRRRQRLLRRVSGDSPQAPGTGRSLSRGDPSYVDPSPFNL